MSYTELYRITKGGKVVQFAETHNSHRGAMAIWMIMEKKYLHPYFPSWATQMPENDRYYRCCGGDKEALTELWDLIDKNFVSFNDKVVLGSTYDNVYVKRENIDELLTCFDEFGGETSLKEQANEIRELIKFDKKFIGIAWNQTSINGDVWLSPFRKDNDGYPRTYNIFKDKGKHWELFDYLKDGK